MFKKTQLPISALMYENSKLVIYTTRLFGLFPIAVRKTRQGFSLKWSLWYALYSFSLGTLILAASYYILYDVFVSKDTIKARSVSDKIVYTGGVTTYAVVILSGFFIVPSRFQLFFKYVRCLSQIDAVIKTTFTQLDKYTSALMLLGLIVLENVCTKLELFLIYTSLGDGADLVEILKSYVGFDLSVLTTLVIEYTNRHLAFGMEKRLRRLNQLLLQQSVDEPPRPSDWDGMVVKTSPLFGAEKGKRTIIETLRVLKKIYMRLIDGLKILNQLHNLCALLEVVSIFFQLIESSYLFIVPLTRNRVTTIEMVPKALLFLIHVTRVLLITEPWYACNVQVETAKGLVSRMLAMDVHGSYRREVRSFALILGLRPFKFTACGLFTVDRLLFTSLIESITTLLVILLQHKEDDEG